MKLAGTPYYSVIQDTIDFCGMGEYLHKFRCGSYEKAKNFLDGNPECTHIDYFDGQEWHHCITGAMSGKPK